MKEGSNIVIVIAGETASGKSGFAIDLAKFLLLQDIKTRIINADSQQSICELPILTDQPVDYQGIVHDLYGYRAATDETSSFTWVQSVMQILERTGDEVSIVVGGSGFYIRNLVEGHWALPKNEHSYHMDHDSMYNFIMEKDPKCSISKNDRYRVARHCSLLQHPQKIPLIIKTPRPFITILLKSPHVEQKIASRIDQTFALSKQEVALHINNLSLSRIIGFREIRDHILNNVPIAQTKELMRIRVRQYAKRQRTWFKKMRFDFIGTREEIMPQIQEEVLRRIT